MRGKLVIEYKNKYWHLFILSIAVFMLFSYCRLQNKNYFLEGKTSENIFEFYRSGKVCNPLIEKCIEVDYFSKNPWRNGDFSEGRSYWAQQAENSQELPKNKFLITDKEYLSPPSCLQIVALGKLPCRLFYSKNRQFSSYSSPLDFRKSNIWLGVKSKKFVSLSLYYKGAAPTVYIYLLKENGKFKILSTKMLNESALNWKNLEIAKQIPENGRAIALEITMNKNQPGRIMFLDDVKLEVN